MNEQELQQILKQNPAVKINKNPHFAQIKRADGLEYYEQQQDKMKSKYRNNRVVVDGILFDSQKEADYYRELKLMLRTGIIKGFCRQPEFLLQEGNDEVRPIKYRADFIVFYASDRAEVIDTKGYLTDVYKIKKKMFKKRFPNLELIER
jgi:hypothetical protein